MVGNCEKIQRYYNLQDVPIRTKAKGTVGNECESYSLLCAEKVWASFGPLKKVRKKGAMQ